MTRPVAVVALLLSLSGADTRRSTAAEEPAVATPVAALEDEVRAAERAFAKAMADRDLAAFESHVAQEAVFFGREALRGRAAVVAAWKAYFEGPQAPFSWEPEHVAVVATGTLGLSSGPVYDPAGKRVGTFNSTWRKEADGRWRVVFDKGCPPCDCR